MQGPVAIGGVGGSGTRIGATLLRALGYYIGDDVNEMLDNLWFTLMFKRRAVLLESADEFARLASLFFARMSGSGLPADASSVVAPLTRDRLQHDAAWLTERAHSFMRHDTPRDSGGAWGWKEPNTHVVIDRLMQFDGELRYIHFVRHPLDMAYSDNKYQLENWGPIMLSREVRLDARDALAYWCAAHRRILGIMARWPDRSLMVDFDAVCDEPQRVTGGIAAFLGAHDASAACDAVARLVQRPPSSGRFREAGGTAFNPEDVRYVASLGYDVAMAPRRASPSRA